MKNLIVCSIAILLFSSEPLRSQSFNKGGRTAFQFVKIGVGARQVALGEASIASVRDVNSAFWNPAGISGIQSVEASFSYTQWFADLKYMAGAAAIRWEGIGTFALSYSTLDYGIISEALITVPSGSSDTRTGATFGGGDVLLGLSFSREFTEQLSIGGTTKFLQEKLYTKSVDLFAFDVGTFYDTKFKGIHLAMAAQNFAGAVKWLANSDREEGYDIPLVFRIGTSFNFIGTDAFINIGESHRIMVNVDALHTNDYGERFHVGGEYVFSDFLAVRAGYKFNYEEGNLSLGLGVQQSVGGNSLRVDYAYVNFKYLDSPHRLTVSIAF